MGLCPHPSTHTPFHSPLLGEGRRRETLIEGNPRENAASAREPSPHSVPTPLHVGLHPCHLHATRGDFIPFPGPEGEHVDGSRQHGFPAFRMSRGARDVTRWEHGDRDGEGHLEGRQVPVAA